MLISDEEVEKIISKISSGTHACIIDNELIIIKYPDNYQRYISDIYYDKEYEKAISDGLLDRASLEKLLEERNLFTTEEQTKLDGLRSKLEGQKVLLAKTTLVKANQDRIKKIIAELNEEISELIYKKTSKLSMSAEVKANEERSLYLCWVSAFNEAGQKIWRSLDDFKQEHNINYRDTILADFLKFYRGTPTNIIRYIARHSMWRIRYVNSQKTGEQLFGVPTVDYTTDMLNLAYWSNYYDNIYQMLPEDRPSDLVIEDDDALDAYMKSYYEERNREDAARRSKNKNPGKLSAFDSEEVIVTASNELWQDIDYDKPREAQKVKERADLKKRTKRG